MIINDEKKLLRFLWLYRYLFFISFQTDNPKLIPYVKALNIKSRYKRINYIYETICNQIDLYYSSCKLCDFKNCVCVAYRKKKLNYKNGCCRRCIHQTDHGCSTMNVACKLFLCSSVSLDGLKMLTAKDIGLLKVLNPYQRYVLANDYFATKEQAVIDIYVGPICYLFRLLYRGVIYFYRRKKI